MLGELIDHRARPIVTGVNCRNPVVSGKGARLGAPGTHPSVRDLCVDHAFACPPILPDGPARAPAEMVTRACAVAHLAVRRQRLQHRGRSGLRVLQRCCALDVVAGCSRLQRPVQCADYMLRYYRNQRQRRRHTSFEGGRCVLF